MLWGCNNKPAGNDSVIGEPQTNKREISSGTKYMLDTSSSIITWIGSRPAKQHNGTIDILEGYLLVNDSDIIGGSIEIDIKTLDIKDLEDDSEDFDKLKNHLMSEDFFYADSFQIARFELINLIPFDSTIKIVDKVEFETDNTPALLSKFMVRQPTHYVTGNLTMRGITKSITFPANVISRNDKIITEAKFNIDRTEWNLSYNDEASVLDKAKDKFIYNTVNVGFSLHAIKERVEN